MEATVARRLALWLKIHCMGRKKTSRRFNRSIMRAIRQHWPNRKMLASEVTAEQVLSFARCVTDYCPSRWNAIVSAIRFVTLHGKLLDRRPLKLLHFIPPGQMQFETFLAECDKASKRGSHAGLVVRFLVLSSLRYSEAYNLKWETVFDDRIEVPAAIAKSGKARTLPIIEGLREVLSKLREITAHSGFVLPRSNPKKAITSAARRVGPNFKWSYHRCRHFFGTRAVECGVDIPTVARWFGHQDGGALLAKGYFHLLDGHSRRMAEKVKIAA
jgi:integrase